MLECLLFGGASMSLVLHLAPRVVVVVAWALAFTVAAGASTPRLRAPGRERVARAGIARAGSQRPDDPRAWVAPDSAHDPEYTVADAVVHPTRAAVITPLGDGLESSLAPARWTAAAPSPAVVTNPCAAAPRLKRWLVRADRTRAPPVA
jgi:hypothetical protein